MSVYFIVSIFLFIIWLFVYLLSFIISYNENILLIFSKVLYSISIPAMYSMFFFVKLFPSKQKINYKDWLIFILFIILILISLLTNLVIFSMDFLKEANIYKEKF
jgi:hypothetical protein